MESLRGKTADEAWRGAVELWRRNAHVQPGRDQETRELVHVGISIDDPRSRLVFSRPINPAFAFVEAVWILAGRNDVEFVRRWNPRMKNYSDDGVSLHGAYGDRLRNHFGLDQLEKARLALDHAPDSRQVVLQIWDARTDVPSPHPRARDIPCNVLSHLLIRNGKLDWLQVMRSSDLVWGLPYNFVQFTTIQEIVAGWLGADVGAYDHVSSSLHVYRRHWPDLESALPPPIPVRNDADLRLPHDEWTKLLPQLESFVWELSDAPAERIGSLLSSFAAPAAYQEAAALLAAERLRRLGHDERAEDAVNGAGLYWATSWRMWAAAALDRRQAKA